MRIFTGLDEQYENAERAWKAATSTITPGAFGISREKYIGEYLYNVYGTTRGREREL